MAGVSQYLQNAILNEVAGGSNYAPPATLYVGLWTVGLNDAATGSTAGEISGGGYARVAVTNNATNWPSASHGVKSNASKVTFPYATSEWGTVRTVAILDAATAGNILFFATPAPVVTVSALDTLVFQVGDLSLSLS